MPRLKLIRDLEGLRRRVGDRMPCFPAYLLGRWRAEKLTCVSEVQVQPGSLPGSPQTEHGVEDLPPQSNPAPTAVVQATPTQATANALPRPRGEWFYGIFVHVMLFAISRPAFTCGECFAYIHVASLIAAPPTEFA